MNVELLLGASMSGPQSLYLIQEWYILECKWISNAQMGQEHFYKYTNANTVKTTS